ncbi:flippase [Allocoleopsis sp.]|uniref:flippase n=1 Tax=Allocoleopsis sp. TaxID=3088169 RepID=UPI002FD18194
MLKKIVAIYKNLSPNLRKIIGNTGWLFTEKIVQLVLGLLVGVWITRYLGPERFGRFNYAIAIVGLFVPLAKLGLDSIVIRNLARDPSCQNETLGTAFVLKLISSSLTFLATLGFIILFTSNSSLYSQETLWLVGIIASGTVVQSFEIIDFWFQSQIQSKYSVITRNVAYVIMTGVKIVLLQVRAPLIAFAIAMSVEYVLSAIGYLISYRFSGNLIRSWKVSFGYAKTLLKDSWPLILSGIVIMIYLRIDQVMLGQMVGDRAVGIYSAAVKISELWYFVPSAIVSSVFPYIVKAKDIGEEVYYKRLQQLFSAVSILAYAVAIPVTFLATPIVTLLYGKNYTEAGAILNVHIWAGLFVSLGVARETWITTEGLMKFSAATAAAGAVVNIVLNYFLIPYYGGLGAAIATVIAQIVSDYAVGAFYPPTRKIFIQQTKGIALLGLMGR